MTTLTKDEIKALARAAKIIIPTRFSYDRVIDELTRFATLCRADLVAEIKNWKEDQKENIRVAFDLQREVNELRAKLAAYESMEPVGEVAHLNELNDEWLEKLPIGTKLYTAPAPQAQRELSDAEIDAAWRSVDYTQPYDAFRMAVGRAVLKAAGGGV